MTDILKRQHNRHVIYGIKGIGQKQFCLKNFSFVNKDRQGTAGLFLEKPGQIIRVYPLPGRDLRNSQFFINVLIGAYQGFFDNNIQADFVHIDHIWDYKVLYFPYPVSLEYLHAEKLKNWVKDGGVLISEACPAYFGDMLHAGAVQPNYGFDEVFGVSQKRVEFMPDILTDIEFNIFGTSAGGEGYLQTYELKGASPCAYYEGDPIAASNTWGKGKTLLIGAFVSGRYGRLHDSGTGRFFRELLSFAGQTPAVQLGDNTIHARISLGQGEDYLWLLNTQDKACSCTLKLSSGYCCGKILWEGGSIVEGSGGAYIVSLEPRDALILTINKE
jgi:beta-galactosidase